MRKCRRCVTGYMAEVYYDTELVVQGTQLVVEGLVCLRCNNCKAEIETVSHMDYNADLVRDLFAVQKERQK